MARVDTVPIYACVAADTWAAHAMCTVAKGVSRPTPLQRCAKAAAYATKWQVMCTRAIATLGQQAHIVMSICARRMLPRSSSVKHSATTWVSVEPMETVHVTLSKATTHCHRLCCQWGKTVNSMPSASAVHSLLDHGWNVTAMAHVATIHFTPRRIVDATMVTVANTATLRYARHQDAMRAKHATRALVYAGAWRHGRLRPVRAPTTRSRVGVCIPSAGMVLQTKHRTHAFATSSIARTTRGRVLLFNAHWCS
jgi:hypothetical protein